jgi:hypothetical protein
MVPIEDRKHGAVSADHDGQLGAAADGFVVDPPHRVAERGGGLLLDQDLAAARLEQPAQLPQGGRDLGAVVLADQGHAAEG